MKLRVVCFYAFIVLLTAQPLDLFAGDGPAKPRTSLKNTYKIREVRGGKVHEVTMIKQGDQWIRQSSTPVDRLPKRIKKKKKQDLVLKNRLMATERQRKNALKHKDAQDAKQLLQDVSNIAQPQQSGFSFDPEMIKQLMDQFLGGKQLPELNDEQLKKLGELQDYTKSFDEVSDNLNKK